jgi:hypothetical protein
MESVLTEYKDFLLTALDGIDQDIGISLGLVASHMLILETPFLALRFGLCGKRKMAAQERSEVRKCFHRIFVIEHGERLMGASYPGATRHSS